LLKKRLGLFIVRPVDFTFVLLLNIRLATLPISGSVPAIGNENAPGHSLFWSPDRSLDGGPKPFRRWHGTVGESTRKVFSSAFRGTLQ
jgi:hypothetical protein